MDKPLRTYILACTCGARAGFTCVNDWWICSSCRLPAYGYLQAVINGTASFNRHGSEEQVSSDGLIYFEGGPNDGQAYKTKDLLGHQALTIPIVDYVWTSETKTSEKTGTVAQIWRYKGLTANQNNPPGPAPAPLPAPVATPVSTVTEEPVVITEPAEPVAATGHVDAPAADAALGTSEEQELVDHVNTAVEGSRLNAGVQVISEPNGLQVEVGQNNPAPQPQSALPTGEELMQRRKALKLSVGAVGDKAGLAHSKVASIEKGTGKRIKDEEIRQLADAVAALEAERGGVSAR